MRVLVSALPPLLSRLSNLALWISGVGLVLMTLFVGWQVFGRYALNASPSWTEPASLLLMSWFILLGAAVGVREGNHLGFETGLHYAPRPLRFAMLVVTDLLVILFGAGMAWYGAQLAIETWPAKMAGLAVPQGMDYLPLAVGGALITLFAAEKLARLILLGEAEPLVAPDTDPQAADIPLDRPIIVRPE